MRPYNNVYNYAIYTPKYYEEFCEDKCLAGYQYFCTL